MSEWPEDEIVEGVVVEDDAVVALPTPPDAAMDYTEDGVPTFEFVRNRIEGRVATSIGTAELDADTTHVASLDEQAAAREQAGRDRLAEIRRSMHTPPLPVNQTSD